VPVIVSGLIDEWPAARWADDEPNEHWVYLRVAQSIVRSLMRRGHGLPPYPTGASRPNPVALFGVTPFADGAQLENQYINLDAVGSAYRHPLLAGYERPPLVQPSRLKACFPERTDTTDAHKQSSAPYIHSRWVLVSTAGSGSAWHVDPWNTSAWNALLHGRKRWALYPPGVGGLPDGVANASPSSFFREVLPTLPPAERPLQCVLEAGEVMFLPSGWWHTVLNLSPTVAITENRVDDSNVHKVLDEMRAADPASARGRLAAARCRVEAARPTPFDRGVYPRNCESRLIEAQSEADGMSRSEREVAGLRAHLDCVRQMEAPASAECAAAP
jgi:hypothetical protein